MVHVHIFILAGKPDTGGDPDNTELKETANGHANGPGPSKPTENGIDAIQKDGQRSDGGDTAQSHSSGHSKKSKTTYEKIAISRQTLKDIKQIGKPVYNNNLNFI